MPEPTPSLIDRLKTRFGERLLSAIDGADMAGGATLEVAPAHWLEVARALRDEPEFGFEQLIDLCGVDYLAYGDDEWDTSDVSSEGFSRGVEGLGPGRFRWENRPQGRGPDKRFAVVVHLLSVRNNRRVQASLFCAGPYAADRAVSLTGLFPVSNWFEREAFDLFGIVFDGHPDLRRILTDYGFVGHPFRKDFPLIGNVEVRYDPEKQRVVYEPVSIDPRVSVPRVIRHDSRWQQAAAEGTQGNKP